MRLTVVGLRFSRLEIRRIDSLGLGQRDLFALSEQQAAALEIAPAASAQATSLAHSSQVTPSMRPGHADASMWNSLD